MNNLSFHIQFKKDDYNEWLCWIVNHHEFIELAVKKYPSDIKEFTLQCTGKIPNIKKLIK